MPRAALRLSEAPWAEELEAVEEYPILQDTDQDLQIPGSVDSVEVDLQSFKITDSR